MNESKLTRAVKSEVRRRAYELSRAVWAQMVQAMERDLVLGAMAQSDIARWTPGATTTKWEG